MLLPSSRIATSSNRRLSKGNRGRRDVVSGKKTKSKDTPVDYNSSCAGVGILREGKSRAWRGRCTTDSTIQRFPYRSLATHRLLDNAISQEAGRLLAIALMSENANFEASRKSLVIFVNECRSSLNTPRKGG
ncbi:hypothetical protein HZH66_005985 [Vespula vulgaris]|uniref:Uncharacterized protein n=1 Tax=Vespula vulgaris TaxID=7454 RepID=A0A834KBE0_VESVU|nr:hypothetical protein HZH66_005985 [Vespula vulgaris]